MERLKGILNRIEGESYKAYKQLAGLYHYEAFDLRVEHVQGDPFAQASRISIRLTPDQHGLPPELWNTRIRQTASEDFLARAVASALKRRVKGSRGTGHSGQISIATSGQQVLRRNAVLIEDGGIEVRLLFALPADGRSIRIPDAREMFFQELPQVVVEGLNYCGRDLTPMLRQVEQVEDQQFLRNWLVGAGAVAFVADGSLLPRATGVDDRPLAEGIRFCSPESLRCQVTLPHRGLISGMCLPQGVSLIVGGGFHGKSTLLQALERGVYNHLPGDGRELVVTTPTAVKIRAEDHRAIHQVDITPFINHLPGARPTDCFSTGNASGSTSQAANIIEALECEAACLLIDEDSSATNFMIRDQRMQQLVSDAQEPITPLLQRVRELYEEAGVSSIIVMGGSGDYLSVADRVLQLDNYQVLDVSSRAADLAGEGPLPIASSPALRQRRPRWLPVEWFDARRADGKPQIVTRADGLLDYGRQHIDLSRVEQLVDEDQLETIGRLLEYYGRHYPLHPGGMLAGLRQSLRDAEEQGLDILSPWKVGHLALPRLYELVAAANRMRPGVSL
ncbi:ABC-ATPase domain-containing protein [Geopsychrobacter electrodiphilus]|uniref:ABC-ATPase domain-containing protein n=1 Tax=Geopsychrobacter electrodiphilus TaxID=225196 RepID=UPI00039E36B8|nr:ABC-ATPase domain-containing protein [Geopsychrobacter electrodiphilus]